jgi:hypothetical protein
MTEPLDQKPTELWAITSYFNPIGYRNRSENYKVFRTHLNVPLITVELAYGSQFELEKGDADILVQLSGGDVMWQKERLLNIALEALPPTCTKVAWIDCDVIFENTDWAVEASSMLDRYPLIQLFEQVHYMPRDAVLETFDKGSAEVFRIAFASAVASGIPAIDCLEQAIDRTFGRYSVGMAWAARRELIERHGLYDCCILGAGDRALVSAAVGHFEHSVQYNNMTSWERSKYLDWAKPFHEDTRAQVGFVTGDLWHLWHGSLKNRHYLDRHANMPQFAFNPTKDIEIDENGLWRWKSPKLAFHKFVRDYFSSRNEDG